jgi:hypothetical protein
VNEMKLKNVQMRGFVRQLVLIISFVVMLYTNLFSGGSDSNSIYYLFPTAITPAVYTFAIWAAIFIGLSIFVIYQALPSNRDDKNLDALAWPVFIAFISNALTPYTPLGWSNVAIIILLIALIYVFIIIKSMKIKDKKFFWYVNVPFSLFFGWITAATVVNTFQWLSSLGFQIFGPDGILTAAFFIIVAAAIGVYITIKYHEVIYGLVLIWAFWGIAFAHLSATPIVLSTILGTIALILAIIWNNFRNKPLKIYSKNNKNRISNH